MIKQGQMRTHLSLFLFCEKLFDIVAGICRQRLKIHILLIDRLQLVVQCLRLTQLLGPGSKCAFALQMLSLRHSESGGSTQKRNPLCGQQHRFQLIRPQGAGTEY